ncbi:prolipoprotein diacylglyceryl transferase [Bdellovibrio bacteriovorus]|uniref:Putative prolipoprotein diacylglycerol transferase n=1 Tax=Bdellovibrio bacteriovorus str. Tiberius TaxID=1069642 RepID=K7Z1P4_BDEBC|nr:prolipoprotein diacylglyceryl transferase [Bdellovibrio bacteriovorus]AFY02970.1 putative prolipoprotein diacylglycerol transferase [Bdellovibrio bacteriovorus str. Tiberius]
MFPFIPLSPTLNVPTYYLVLSLTVCLCLFWISLRADKFELSRKVALDLSLIIMVTGFIGGRLFHVFYENFEHYQEDFARIFYFWNGGFVFYGGAILAGLCSLLYMVFVARVQFEDYLDLFAPVLSFAYVLGRVACLLAGCCYGGTCDLPWAVNGLHPTQAYASLWELGVLFILLGTETTAHSLRPKLLKNPGSIFFLWMVLHGMGRLLMEAFRDDFRGPSLGLSISSWISLTIMALGLFLMIRKPARRS